MSSPFFSKYLSEIGNIPLLTPEREAELGRIAQIGLRSGATGAQNRASEEARNELIRRNLKLVVSIANRFLSCGLTLEEMTFDGNQGLTEAAKRFNPFLFQNRFSTYASFWIQQAIRQGIQRAHTVRVPSRRANQLRHIFECRSFVEDGRDQDVETIHQETGIPRQRITRILNHPCTVVSLNLPRGDSDEGIEAVISDGSESPAELAMTKEELELLRIVLSELSPVEQHIVCSRFGIQLEETATLDSLAEDYGVSRERIRQIEKHALQILRRKLEQFVSRKGGMHERQPAKKAPSR